MMRLAYLSTDPGIRFGGAKGAAVHIGEIVAALAAEGHELLVLVAGVEPGFSPSRGVTVDVLPGRGKGASVADLLGSQAELAAWLSTRLGRFGPAAIYERLALYSGAGAELARRLGVPYIVEINAPLLEEAERYRTLEQPAAAAALERATLETADLVFAVSPPLATYAAVRGASRVEVLQNAAAIERFPPPRRGRADPVAVFVGSLRPWHGIATIAEAWKRLGASAPALLVVGDGPARGSLDRIATTITGAVPPGSIPGWLARADIGLAPYDRAAPGYFSPIKLFEYLAAGLATVVGDLPAVTDVVGPDTAVVIPRGDAAALANAVAALCADPPERRRLGDNGRALVETAHTWRHRARRILAVAAEMAPVGAEA
jgi:glycosyltransferase involved in cell wall biosynthesis